MIREIVVFFLLLIALVLLLIYYRRSEKKYLNRRALEAMSPDLREEIETERRINLEKHQKFEEALRQEQSKTGGSQP